ncbi:MAG: helix-turn-helix transcriptional regulator [Clostridia bacterium]|nr:helix-turn-helix transcriptional regulator [Clostridia bacterium]MBR5010424.1 helix-turn-helix transcriptional regulator [Clostridia bacterium]MBR5257992.1 helix-turn-helix transcriptional regulator [Clostridia bacterium]MBR5985130.1 helix-turn-helix transcriptional regulator [Clostridia bacterium]
MQFSEKLVNIRKSRGLSQQDLSRLSGLSRRALAYYESGERLPRHRATIEALSHALNVGSEELMDENCDFICKAGETYGESGKKEAARLIGQIKSLYAGGSLSPKDMDEMMLAIQDAYWIAKKRLSSAAEAAESEND